MPSGKPERGNIETPRGGGRCRRTGVLQCSATVAPGIGLDDLRVVSIGCNEGWCHEYSYSLTGRCSNLIGTADGNFSGLSYVDDVG
jgi:hypothetical protein